MSNKPNNKETKLIGSIQEDLKKPIDQGPRHEIRFLTPEGEGDRVSYPGYVGQYNGTDPMGDSEAVKIYPSVVEFGGERSLKLVARKVLKDLQPATNRDGNFVNSEGEVVQSAEEASQVIKPVINSENGKRVHITVGEFFLSDKSHKGTPYGQTMATGRFYDAETGRELARQSYKAGNMKEAGNQAGADQVYAKMKDMKKEKGQFVSMFINKKLAAEFASRFNIDIKLPEKSRNNNYDDFDDDVPF